MIKKTNLPLNVPIFPLKGVILFPNSVLPLNIFEPRYIAMVEKVLMSNHRMIGIVQPYATNEEKNKLKVHEIGCLGKIFKFEELEDNRYLISLKGVSRFRVISEKLTKLGYKTSEIIFKNFEDDSVLCEYKEFKFKNDKRLKLALKKYFKEKDLNPDWTYIEKCENQNLVNQIAMICPFEPDEKQMLLESKFIEDRYILLTSILENNISQKRDENVLKH